jgi:rhodanese-related sulfurtransferase
VPPAPSDAGGPIRSILPRVSRTPHTLAELLADARARIERLSPSEAWEAVQAGACLIDIRASPETTPPGAVHVPRTVLEWRLAPDSAWRNPLLGGPDDRIVILCDHGESSSLAAAGLVELGFRRAGDVTGGAAAWEAAGLPLVPAPPRAEPPGMGGPARAAS